MKKKLLVPVIVILLFVLCFVTYYLMPKTFCKKLNPNDVNHINVFDGNTGRGFTISNPDDIRYIVENIQSHPTKRDGLSLGRMGYLFKISLLDSNDKDLVPLFYINSENTIRKDPFFYTCQGGLCADYLTGLEPDTSIEASAQDDSIAICIDGVTYYGLGEAIPVEPDESAIEYVEIPAGSDGATITAVARLEEGKMIVCLLDGEWYKFHSMEALASSEVRLENEVPTENVAESVADITSLAEALIQEEGYLSDISTEFQYDKESCVVNKAYLDIQQDGTDELLLSIYPNEEEYIEEILYMIYQYDGSKLSLKQQMVHTLCRQSDVLFYFPEEKAVATKSSGSDFCNYDFWAMDGTEKAYRSVGYYDNKEEIYTRVYYDRPADIEMFSEEEGPYVISKYDWDDEKEEDEATAIYYEHLGAFEEVSFERVN